MTVKNNKFLLVLFVFIIIASIFASFTITVEADTDCPICGGKHNLEDLGGLQRTAYDMCCVVYGGSSISDDLRETLRFDTTGSKFSALWTRGKGFYESLRVIGELLCIVYGLISLYEKVSQDQHSAEHIFKLFMKIIFGVLFIRIGYDIIEAGLTFASGVFDTFASGTTGVAGLTGCKYDEVLKQSFLEPVGTILSLFIPWIAMQVATIAIHVVCWARVLDIMVRAIFAPIGLADLAHTGMNGNGFNYLKKLVSSALQGAVLFGSMKGYSLIVQVTQTLGAGGMMVTIVLSFSLISILFKAKTIADDMLGV